MDLMSNDMDLAVDSGKFCGSHKLKYYYLKKIIIVRTKLFKLNIIIIKTLLKLIYYYY
jgi:hypothetical protein